MEKPGDFEVTYRCTAPKCGNQQTLLFFVNEEHTPATCCTKCRAGFGVELGAMVANHIGMFPVSRVVVTEEDVAPRGPVSL